MCTGMGVGQHRPSWLSEGQVLEWKRQEELKANDGFHRKRGFKGPAGKWATITASATKSVRTSSGGAISFLVAATSSVDLGPLGVYFRVGRKGGVKVVRAQVIYKLGLAGKCF